MQLVKNKNKKGSAAAAYLAQDLLFFYIFSFLSMSSFWKQQQKDLTCRASHTWRKSRRNTHARTKFCELHCGVCVCVIGREISLFLYSTRIFSNSRISHFQKKKKKMMIRVSWRARHFIRFTPDIIDM